MANSDDASVSSTVHSYISLQEEYGISCSSASHDEEDDSDVDSQDDDDDEHAALQRHHPYNSSLSRLSVCTTNSSTLVDQDDGNSVDHETHHDLMITVMSSQFKSRLSLTNDEDEDADQEFSDVKDSEDEGHQCCSLPSTPPIRRTKGAVKTKVKEYSSENEVHKRRKKNKDKNKRLKMNDSHVRRWVMGEVNKRDDDYVQQGGEKEGGGSSTNTGGLVMTRPMGRRRSPSMGFEEVKACCRDLDTLEFDHRISNNADVDPLSSGASSPIISTWPISSPGDDPRDVKARLKVWAHAVALASSSTCSSPASSHHGN